MSDVLGLVAFGGIVVALWLAIRKIKTQQVAAVAAAHVSGIEAGRAAVLADIGASVVVHNHQHVGHRVGIDAADDSADDRAAADYRAHLDAAGARLDLGRYGSDPRILHGVPVGSHLGDLDGDAGASRSAALQRLNSDEALHVVRSELGRGPGS